MATKLCFSHGESQFIFKAVGEILLEIQTYISGCEQPMDISDCVCPKLGAPTLSGREKQIRFTSNKAMSAEDVMNWQSEMAEPKINYINQWDCELSHSKAQALSDRDRGIVDNVVKSPKSLKNRLPFKIESFFRFGRLNQIFYPSAEVLILSLIYIDRFINMKGIENFNITR